MSHRASREVNREVARRSLPAWHRWLELLGLWTLALAQPLLSLLGGNAPFLLHHRADAVDLALLCGLIVVVPPFALWGLEALVGRLLGPARQALAREAVSGGLVAILVLGVLRQLGDPLPTWVLPPLALLLAWSAARLTRRWPGVRRFFALLAVTLPVPVVLFWSSPAAEAARASAARDAGSVFLDAAGSGEEVGEEGRSERPAPVVLVVFDELPVLSLLDADLGIDPDCCPNLARLAATSTWYRNASTVWSMTNPSIASLLTGRMVDPGTPPTLESLPRNLLSWLSATHEIRAFELSTSLAPASRVDLRTRRPRLARLGALASDSVAIAGHLALPVELAGWLPPIDNRWGDFWHRRVVRGEGGGGDEAVGDVPWAFALGDGRARAFGLFLESIRPPAGSGARSVAYFAHVMLPHMPFRYLPSGRVYGGRAVTGDGARAWSEDRWFAVETYQRHMLQVGFVDRLVGGLVDRLRSVGLWDEALVVLLADHGASYWPGEDRRKPGETEHPRDIWRIPLFIKFPHQEQGVIDDRPVLSLDVVPTVAAVLGAAVDWPLEGESLMATTSERAVRSFAVDGGATRRRMDGDPRPDSESLARKLELFDPAAGELRWVRLGPHRSMIGRPIEDLDAVAAPPDPYSCLAEVDQQPVVERFDPGSRYSPALLTGRLTCDTDAPADAFLLAAVNGRIAGSGRLRQVHGRRALFAAMTAEAEWKPGENRLDLYLALGGPGDVRLEPIRSP